MAEEATAEPAADAADENRGEDSSSGEILVIATKFAGEIEAAQAPITTLTETDIEAYGANSIGDLITSLAPQTGSGRGRGVGGPVILLNGQRISSHRELRFLSPDALRKVEILPEEVALRYGFPPNQRVINFILKDSFAVRSIDLEANFPKRGGFYEGEYEASLLKISKGKRFNLNLRLDDTSLLTEAERGVPQDAVSLALSTNPGQFRSLIDDSRTLSLNGTFANGIGKGAQDGSYSINGALSRRDSRGLTGLDTFRSTALLRLNRTDTVNLGLSLTKPLGLWLLSSTLDAGHVSSRTTTDRPAAAPVSEVARSRNLTLSQLNTLTGSLAQLPAGRLTTTVKLGYDYTRLRSSNTSIAGLQTDQQLVRSDISAGLNVAVPISSRRENVMPGIGDLTLNFSAGLNRLSDFGTLKDWSAGLTWSPVEKLTLGASYIVNESAPSLGDLGNPLVQTPNVTVFDYTRNTTALVTVIRGGNRALKNSTNRDIKLSANWQIPGMANSSLLVEYFRNRSENVVSALPLLTPQIEAAFGSRVTRNAAGELIAIDQRAISLARSDGSRLRWGINIGGTVGKPTPGSMRPRGGPGGAFPGGFGPPPGGGAPHGGGGPGFGGGMMGGGMMGGGNGQGRWNLALYHTARFGESVLVAPGIPRLNLLEGDALSGGGVARHALDLEGGVFYRGTGLRLNGTWAAPTRVITPGSNLRFGSVFDLDLRLFINMDQKKKLVEKTPVLKGVRLSLVINNLLDSRQRVTDATGIVPLTYDPDRIDPRGRMIGIDLRKNF